MQVKVHALLTHPAVAFATLVEHTVPQVPQSLRLLVVSTQLPLHSVGVEPAQPDTHVEFAQAGVPPLHAWLQDEQFFGSLVRLTHAPLQSVYPLLQLMPQLPPLHDGAPLATDGQECPQLPQLFASVEVLVQVPPHSVGVPDEHPDTQEYELPEPEHTGVAASAVHATPQAPQLVAVVYCAHWPLHSE
jgi:hypothetical protein